ncbi:MAG: hypothetical protein AB3N24_05990 [Leisingera sp.]
MSQNLASLYEDLESPAQAYTVRRHLEVGDEAAAQIVAAMPPGTFTEHDWRIFEAFCWGFVVGQAG